MSPFFGDNICFNDESSVLRTSLQKVAKFFGDVAVCCRNYLKIYLMPYFLRIFRSGFSIDFAQSV